jgi:hypothetical protein
MPVQATYDLLTDPPRPVESPFELAARRIMATWLETRDVIATPHDLKLAAQFLKRVGLTLEPLSQFEVRLVSERGRSTVLTREAAVMTAIRSLVTLDLQRASRSIPRAA